MTLEEKLTAAEARIVELESQLEGERASTSAMTQLAEEAEAARNEESALNSQLQGELKSLRQQHTDATAKIARLEAEAKTAEAKAAEICASVGVEPLEVTPRGESAASKEMTRAEFDALDPRARNDFLNRGGKITRP